MAIKFGEEEKKKKKNNKNNKRSRFNRVLAPSVLGP